ncbi:hypothetical protein AVEN_235364-1 [Araneus ventricosus]|uniref:Uncharacterized protein n=1 Tax=Araneus ventricosus TaxID=182803 RepID=A0A4Y2A3W2_ARAVE|nr:hypothetical protein AVEN_235364-1 [Araneus ventricosus]
MVLVEKMNSLLYQDVLPDSLLPVTPLITSGDLTFQQINASDAYSVLYKILHEGECGKNSSMAISESRPESNGSLCGILAQDVYKNGRQYRSKFDPKTATKNCWNNVDPETFEALSGSMNRRLMRTIEKKEVPISLTKE